MKKKKKKGFTKVERFLYKSSLVIIVFLVVGIVFTSTAVSKMNIELQDMNKKVEKALDTNESLAMRLMRWLHLIIFRVLVEILVLLLIMKILRL